jgi:hypothetical protein
MELTDVVEHDPQRPTPALACAGLPRFERRIPSPGSPGARNRQYLWWPYCTSDQARRIRRYRSRRAAMSGPDLRGTASRPYRHCAAVDLPPSSWSIRMTDYICDPHPHCRGRAYATSFQQLGIRDVQALSCGSIFRSAPLRWAGTWRPEASATKNGRSVPARGRRVPSCPQASTARALPGQTGTACSERRCATTLNARTKKWWDSENPREGVAVLRWPPRTRRP